MVETAAHTGKSSRDTGNGVPAQCMKDNATQWNDQQITDIRRHIGKDTDENDHECDHTKYTKKGCGMGQSIPCLFYKSKKSAICIVGRSMLHIIIRLFNKSTESPVGPERIVFYTFIFLRCCKDN